MLQKSSFTSPTDTASKEQKRFHELLEKIQLLKKIIEEKKQLASKLSQLKNEQVMPLLNQLRDVKLAQIRALDWASERLSFTKRLKIRLSDEIIDRINELQYSFTLSEIQEAEIISILSRHSGASEEELLEVKKENEEDALREYLRSHYGIELDEDETDLNNPEIVEKIKAKIEEEKSQKSRNKKATDQERQTDKAEGLQDKLSKSIRSVYTSLVKFLHPDKEMDELKKLDKTEAIKEVTLAYENKDMLSLLILQSKYGLVEEKLDDSDLRNYTTILKKQAKELEDQHRELINASYGVPVNNEKALDKFLKSEKSHLKKHIKQEQHILQGIFENEELLIDYLKQGYY